MNILEENIEVEVETFSDDVLENSTLGAGCGSGCTCDCSASIWW